MSERELRRPLAVEKNCPSSKSHADVERAIATLWQYISKIMKSVPLEKISLYDMEEIKKLVRRAMSPKAAPLAMRALEAHEQSLRKQCPDGRTLFKLCQDEKILGLCGIHHYEWQPSFIAWASWFIVDPEHRRSKIPLRLAAGLFAEARKAKIRKIFVETYSDDADYSNIASILPRCGFQLESTINNFFEEGVDCLVYSLNLDEKMNTGSVPDKLP